MVEEAPDFWSSVEQNVVVVVEEEDESSDDDDGDDAEQSAIEDDGAIVHDDVDVDARSFDHEHHRESDDNDDDLCSEKGNNVCETHNNKNRGRKRSRNDMDPDDDEFDNIVPPPLRRRRVTELFRAWGMSADKLNQLLEVLDEDDANCVERVNESNSNEDYY